MKGRPPSYTLAVYPNSNGFAFAVFDGPNRPIDWGLKDVRAAPLNRRCVERVEAYLSRYQPQVLVIEDCTPGLSRRSPRVRRLNRSIRIRGERSGIEVRTVRRGDILAGFASSGACTKQEIATAIAERYPCFEHWVPPERKQWMSEDRRMSLFDAIAMVLTHYHMRDGGGAGQGS